MLESDGMAVPRGTTWRRVGEWARMSDNRVRTAEQQVHLERLHRVRQEEMEDKISAGDYFIPIGSNEKIVVYKPGQSVKTHKDGKRVVRTPRML